MKDCYRYWIGSTSRQNQENKNRRLARGFYVDMIYNFFLLLVIDLRKMVNVGILKFSLYHSKIFKIGFKFLENLKNMK